MKEGKMIQDYMIRGTLKNHPVRFFVSITSDAVEKMREIHQTTPTATAAVGRIMTGTLMMGFQLKGENETVTVVFDGDGEVGKIIAIANGNGDIKCDIYNPYCNVYLNNEGKLDVRKVVGQGKLTVVRDIGLKQPYISQIDILDGEIANDFAYYYVTSEQIPTVTALGVFVASKDLRVLRSGGYLIQVMPGCSEEIIDFLEKKAMEVDSVTALLKKGMNAEEIVKEYFGSYEFEILDQKEIRYKCNCSREKMVKNLIALGKDELNDIIKNDKKAEVICHYCQSKYFFSLEELEKLQ
jgi:molecular chaperone Hsp33